MGRLFWRFFLAIWITIAGAVAVLILLNSSLGVWPPKAPARAQRMEIALGIVAHAISAGRLDVARNYAATLSGMSPPTVVTIAPRLAEAGSPCAGRGEAEMLAEDASDGRCYRVSVAEAPLTFWETYLPHVLPPIAALLASLPSAWLVTRYLVRPVTTVREALAALAGGDFATRIGGRLHGRKDEIARLGHDFDVTAGKLQQLQEAQKRLFHDVSHELRSPLSRLQLAMGLVRRNPQKLDVVLPRMGREIERLDALVEEILTLARLGTSRSWTAELQAIDVVDLLQAIADDAQFEGAARGIRVTYAGPEAFVSRLNGELIYRAIENVVRNALKYSTDNTPVEVFARPAGEDGLAITIANTGPHVAPQDIARLFEPFVRLHGEGTPLGHGLGLAITRSALEAHGGSVTAESRPEGGLVVSMLIPQRL
jgi:hypothetical protein